MKMREIFFLNKKSPFNLNRLVKGENTGISLFINPVAGGVIGENQRIYSDRVKLNESYKVFMPDLKLEVDHCYSDPKTVQRKAKSRLGSRLKNRNWKKKVKNKGASYAPYIRKESAVSLIGKVLGKEFSENNIVFVENLADDLGALNGLVTNGKIYLDLIENGKVSLPTVRHEIVHIAFGRLTKPQQKKLISSIKNTSGFKNSLEGIKKRNNDLSMSDQSAAEEWLAENHEMNINKFSDVVENKNSEVVEEKLNKIMSFVKRLISISYRNQFVIEGFYYAIASGYFSDCRTFEFKEYKSEKKHHI